MGCVFPVNYRCRVDQDDEQSVFRKLIGRAEALAMAPIHGIVRRAPESTTRPAGALLLRGKAVCKTQRFDRQAGWRDKPNQFTLSTRLW